MVLDFSNIDFTYKRQKQPVLRNLSLQIRAQSTVLLGPNGAGKSTLLGLAAGFHVPQRGTLTIAGAQGQNKVGWMPQDIRAVPGLSAREQVAYAGWLGGMKRNDSWIGAASALERVNLAAEMDKPSKVLSGGQLRRVGLAEALVHSPDVLLLDEPTVGLDPAERARFRSILQSLAGQCSVLVSTHMVDDLDELFDDVAVLEKGVVRYFGPVNEFLELGSTTTGSRAAETAYLKVLDEGLA